MKSIADLSVAEYNALVEQVAQICKEDEFRFDGVPLRVLRVRTRRSMRSLRDFADGEDCFHLNVAMRAGNGIYDLALGSMTVELDEDYYKDFLTDRK